MRTRVLTQATAPPATRNASIDFVRATIAVDTLAFGIIVPVVPTLMHLTGLAYGVAIATVWGWRPGPA